MDSSLDWSSRDLSHRAFLAWTSDINCSVSISASILSTKRQSRTTSYVEIQSATEWVSSEKMCVSSCCLRRVKILIEHCTLKHNLRRWAYGRPKRWPRCISPARGQCSRCVKGYLKTSVISLIKHVRDAGIAHAVWKEL